MSDNIVEIAERDGFLFAAVTNTWGPRCPDFEPGCWCCKAWAEYDRVDRLRAINAELVAALEETLEVCSRYEEGDFTNRARAAIAKAESETRTAALDALIQTDGELL